MCGRVFLRVCTAGVTTKLKKLLSYLISIAMRNNIFVNIENVIIAKAVKRKAASDKTAAIQERYSLLQSEKV